MIAHESVRRCRDCPTVLSRYNSSDQCAACERTLGEPVSFSRSRQRQKRERKVRNIGGGVAPEVPIPLRMPEPLPERVRRLRVAMGLNQREFARRCGVLTSVIGHIESGRNAPTLVTFERLCAGLGVTMDALWRGESQDSAS